MTPPPPRPTLFPYTTLFRSLAVDNVLALRVHQHRDLARALWLALGLGARQVDRELVVAVVGGGDHEEDQDHQDRKSTRLNSSHPSISYAVFCLKKKTTHADK